MATNKNVSRARATRALARKVASSLAPTASRPDPGQSRDGRVLAPVQALKDILEEERARLMTAESVLECAMLAMDETDHDQTSGPYYQNVIGVARDLILQTIDHLDSVQVAPILERLALRGGHSVREHVVVYLH